MVAEGTGGVVERAHCSCLCWDFSSASDTSPPSSTAFPAVDAPSGNVTRGAGLLPLPRVHQNDLLLVGVLLFVQAVSAGAAIRHAIPFPGAEGTVDGVA